MDRIRRPKARNIQIVGTNGKGTTALFLQKILYAHGFNVGLYTSPHLVCVEERVRYNNSQITPCEFAETYASLRPLFDELKLSFFEKMTLLAVDFFRQKSLDFIVWEAGLGARLDATTAMNSETILYTPIAKDHCDYLGDTIEEITYEKFFVAQFALTILSSPQTQIVENFMRNKAEVYCKEISFVPQVSNCEITQNTTVFHIEEHQVVIPMLGEYYAQNAQLAWSAAQKLLGSEFSSTAAITGLSKAQWPGRLQIVDRPPLKFLFSCAHNMHSLRSDLSIIDKLIKENHLHKKLGVIFAVTRNRPVEDHLHLLQQTFAEIIISPANDQHPIPQSLKNSSYQQAQSFAEAFKILQKKQIEHFLVIGSIYLVGEAYRYLEVQ